MVEDLSRDFVKEQMKVVFRDMQECSVSWAVTGMQSDHHQKDKQSRTKNRFRGKEIPRYCSWVTTVEPLLRRTERDISKQTKSLKIDLPFVPAVLLRKYIQREGISLPKQHLPTHVNCSSIHKRTFSSSKQSHKLY